MSDEQSRIEALEKRHEKLTLRVQQLIDQVTAHTLILRAASLQEEPSDLLRKLDRVAEVYQDPDWARIRPIAAFVLGIQDT